MRLGCAWKRKNGRAARALLSATWFSESISPLRKLSSVRQQARAKISHVKFTMSQKFVLGKATRDASLKSSFEQ